MVVIPASDEYWWWWWILNFIMLVSGRMYNFWIILIAVFPPAAAAFLCFIFCCPCLRSYRKGVIIGTWNWSVLFCHAFCLNLFLLAEYVWLKIKSISSKYSTKVERLEAGSRRTRDLKAQEELIWQGKSSSEFSVFEFEQLLEATDNFSEENKLGQGGFGAVYKVL